MWNAVKEFFDSQRFMPHGYCFLWQGDIVWLHVISDLIIFAAYYSIPIALVYFARKRPDMPFRLVFGLSSLFIVLCGTTHLFSVWVLWHPDYGPEGIVKALTALVSLITAVLIWEMMPQFLTLPSPLQLQKLNGELLLSQEEITRRVNERTVQLAEANLKLEEAYVLAEKANKAKSEFLANMSHEIRTPMNAVIGLSNILALSSPLSDKQREYIKTLQLSAESLLALITDLLDISKIENESITLDNVPFNLKQLIAEVISIMSVKAEEKSIGLSLQFDDRLSGEFVGDPTRLRQIFLNLISNAVKFTAKGGVDVRATLLVKKDIQQKCALISVADSGIGIPPDKQNSIFNKFSQADNSITGKYGGTGLGLAITKNLIEIMGGAISVASQAGQGATFTVELPLTSGTDIQQAIDLQQPRSDAAHSTAVVEARPHILLVEDYKPNILVATTILESLGYSYEVALNGEEAVARIAQRRFALVLMDVQMPVMDGYTATRLIREREADAGSKRLPIIGITAFAMAGDKQKCLAVGMDEYISKPFNMEDLGAKITALL